MSSAFNIPAGWKIAIEGDTAQIVSPIEGPGITVVAEQSRRLEDRMLFAIAKALATPPVNAVPCEPVAWMIVDEAGDVRKAKPGGKDAFPVYREAIAPAAAAEPSELTTCNCRWQGEKLVQQCTLHEAWRDAIHDWSERAKVAERQLPDRERAASLVASEDTKRLDWLEQGAEKAKSLGYKWDAFTFDFVKYSTIREALDAAINNPKDPNV